MRKLRCSCPAKRQLGPDSRLRHRVRLRRIQRARGIALNMPWAGISMLSRRAIPEGSTAVWYIPNLVEVDQPAHPVSTGAGEVFGDELKDPVPTSATTRRSRSGLRPGPGEGRRGERTAGKPGFCDHRYHAGARCQRKPSIRLTAIISSRLFGTSRLEALIAH